MARDAYHLDTEGSADAMGHTREARIHYAAGVAAERARIIAWLREPRYQANVQNRTLVQAADDLEGKAQ